MVSRSRFRIPRHRLRALTMLGVTAAVAAYRQRSLAQHQARAPHVADRNAGR
jgi:hypothetical protein